MTIRMLSEVLDTGEFRPPSKKTAPAHLSRPARPTVKTIRPETVAPTRAAYVNTTIREDTESKAPTSPTIDWYLPNLSKSRSRNAARCIFNIPAICKRWRAPTSKDAGTVPRGVRQPKNSHRKWPGVSCRVNQVPVRSIRDCVTLDRMPPVQPCEIKNENVYPELRDRVSEVVQCNRMLRALRSSRQRGWRHELAFGKWPFDGRHDTLGEITVRPI